MNHSPDSENQDSFSSFPEQLSFSIAISIVTLIIALVLYSWRTQEKEPPTLSLVILSNEIRESQGQYYIPFTVKNTGGKTVESVQVIGHFKTNGEVEEIGEQQIDFLAGGESASGAFIFSENPQRGELRLRVASYRLP